jgi:chromosome segregation ATPase
MVLVLALLSCSVWAQRGGGGRGGGRGPQQETAGQPRGPMADRGGPSVQERQRIRATDRQRVQYKNLVQAANRVRTRARVMARLAKRAGGSYEQFREQYVALQGELQLMRQEHEEFVGGLNEEQRAASQERDKEMEKDLDELNVWMEAMDEELKQGEPEPKKLEKQAREVEKAVKDWQADTRRLASDLSIE